MEDLLKRHRKEQRDIQSQVTQKRKSATKKTRKGINDECSELERKLKERHDSELSRFNGDGGDLGRSPLDVEALITKEDLSLAEQVQDERAIQSAKSDQNSKPTEDQSVKKPNRQKARLARRAAEQDAAIRQAEEEAANMPDEREAEQESMQQAYTSRNLVEFPVRSDGHCLYAAIADQLTVARIPPVPIVELKVDRVEKADYKFARSVTAAYIEQHADDFVPFLEEPLAEYVAKIRHTGEWGGHLELLALSKAFGHDICVLHGSGQVDKIESGSKAGTTPFWLAYYRHSHGLGEHYNSLRAKG